MLYTCNSYPRKLPHPSHSLEGCTHHDECDAHSACSVNAKGICLYAGAMQHVMSIQPCLYAIFVYLKFQGLDFERTHLKIVVSTSRDHLQI